MQYKTEAELAAALKAAPPRGVYLLYGSEPYLVDAWRNRLTKPFAGGLGEFNLQRLEGRRLDCDALYDAVEALPLMAAEKCVVVEDLDPAAFSPADQEKLGEIVGDLPEGCLLVITGKGAFDGRSAAAKKLIKQVGAGGVVAQLGSRDSTGLVNFLKSAAKEGGCQLSTPLARKILDLCENDMHSLRSEMAKICAYCGEGEITRAHIDAVATVRTEARVFDLGKSILAGNTRRAMELIGDLFYLREKPNAILSTLILSYVDQYRARVARDSGVQQAEVVARFGYKGREFRVRNAFTSRLTLEQLRRSLDILLDCDRKLKSTGVDGRILLEQAVTRLFLAGSR